MMGVAHFGSLSLGMVLLLLFVTNHGTIALPMQNIRPPMHSSTLVPITLTAASTNNKKEPILKISEEKPFHIALRFPSAVGSTVKTLCLTFIQSALFMVPVGLIIKIGSRPEVRTTTMNRVQHWLGEGMKVGVEWSRISALFAAGEEFCEKLR